MYAIPLAGEVRRDRRKRGGKKRRRKKDKLALVWAEPRSSLDPIGQPSNLLSVPSLVGTPVSPAQAKFYDDISSSILSSKSVPGLPRPNTRSIYEPPRNKKQLQRAPELHKIIDPMMGSSSSLHRPYTAAVSSESPYAGMIAARPKTSVGLMSQTSSSLPHLSMSASAEEPQVGTVEMGTRGQTDYAQPGYSPYAFPSPSNKVKRSKKGFVGKSGMKPKRHVALRMEVSKASLPMASFGWGVLDESGQKEAALYAAYRQSAAIRQKAEKLAIMHNLQLRKDELPMEFLAVRDRNYSVQRAARAILAGVLKSLQSSLGFAFLDWRDVARRIRNRENAEQRRLVHQVQALDRLDRTVRRMIKRRKFRKFKRKTDFVWWQQQDRAARTIQRIYRNKKCYADYMHNMAAVAHKKLVQMRLCKRVLAFERHAYKSFYYSRGMQAHIKAAYRAARLLQAHFRRREAMKVFRLRQLMKLRAEALELAVIRVQCAYRCRRARKFLQAARALRLESERRQAIKALELQRMYRGFKGRVRAWQRLEAVLGEARSACLVQRAWRRRVWWKAIKRRFDAMRMKLLEQRMVLAESERKARAAAARLLQQYWHGYVSRRWLALLRERKAWTDAIEDERSGQIARWFKQQQQRWVLVRRCHYRTLLLEKERRRAQQGQVDWAARVATFAALQIQRRMRQMLALNTMSRLFGRFLVSYLKRGILHIVQHRARQLQKFARHRVRHFRLTRKFEVRLKMLRACDAAALTVQRVYRGVLDRELARLIFERNEEARRKAEAEAERMRLHNAAVKVQHAWRLRAWHCMLDRKFRERAAFLAKQLLEAAIMVQRHWRSHVAIRLVRLLRLKRRAHEAHLEYLQWREDEDQKAEHDAADRLALVRRLKDREAARKAGLRRGDKAKATAWSVYWDEQGNSYFSNRITLQSQYETPRSFMLASFCKCAECQVSGKMGLVEDPRPLNRGTFYCFPHWDLFQAQQSLMQQALTEGWMQFFEENTLKIRYLNTVSGESHYDDRPQISALETLRLEAQRKKLEEASHRRRQMAEMRERMNAQKDYDRSMKGWKKEAWEGYWADGKDRQEAFIRPDAEIARLEMLQSGDGGAAEHSTPAAVISSAGDEQ